jgi:hypothetical protein
MVSDPQSAGVLRARFGIFVQKSFFAQSPPWQRDRVLSLHCSLFSLREPGARIARRRTMYRTCLHASGRAAAARARYMGRTPSQSCGSGAPARTSGFDPSPLLSFAFGTALPAPKQPFGITPCSPVNVGLSHNNRTSRALEEWQAASVINLRITIAGCPGKM